jgi:hypothetical protein
MWEKARKKNSSEMPNRITFHSRFCLLLYSNSGAERAKTNNVFHPRAFRERLLGRKIAWRTEKLLHRNHIFLVRFFLTLLSLCAYLAVSARRGRKIIRENVSIYAGITAKQVANKTERQTFIEKRFLVCHKICHQQSSSSTPSSPATQSCKSLQ